MKRRIAILTGGNSTERNIALESAASVQRAIGNRATTELFDFPANLEAYLSRRQEFDCAIPVFHGRGGEDGQIQGFLETLGVPYIFSTVGAHALAMDKPKTNTLMRLAGLRVPESTVVFERTTIPFNHPVVIKPIDGGSSVGVTLAHDQQELDDGVELALSMSPAVIVEDYIAGHEYSVAVIDVGAETKALPVIDIRPVHEFFDYDSKYVPGLAVEVCPADIDQQLVERLQSAAVTAHRAVGVRHVSRSDFIVDDQGQPWFLEINTIPGMSVLLPKAMKAADHDFGQVLLGWVEEVLNLAKHS